MWGFEASSGEWRQCRGCSGSFVPVLKRKGEGLESIGLGEQCTNKGMMSDSWRHEWVSRMNNKLISGLKLR